VSLIRRTGGPADRRTGVTLVQTLAGSFRTRSQALSEHRLGDRTAEGPKGLPSGRRLQPVLYTDTMNRRGFTLIETLVVIAVIAILASIVTPMVFRNVGDAKVSSARAQIEILATALDSYRLDNDYYPSTAQGLGALRTKPSGQPSAGNWRGPYIRKDVSADPWDKPYLYLSPGTINPASYDLLSLGRDGQPGGEGEDADVTSWGRE
jgi:general secretion pathway protein G